MLRKNEMVYKFNISPIPSVEIDRWLYKRYGNAIIFGGKIWDVSYNLLKGRGTYTLDVTSFDAFHFWIVWI